MMASSSLRQNNVSQQRYIPNTTPHMQLKETPEFYVRRALEHIITDAPPNAEYTARRCHGLFSGPTALAFLFLKASAIYPAMKVKDQTLHQWADLYMKARRVGAQPAQCGLMSERAGFSTVKTMLDRDNAEMLLGELNSMLQDPSTPHELLYGYAGLLYMIRVVEGWQPDLRPSFSHIKEELTNRIIAAGPDWTWHGKRYLGAAHGDIGILTQLVLADPSLAEGSFLQEKLRDLLRLQQADGNWPSKEGEGSGSSSSRNGLIQICHGAPGFVVSLARLRPYFPGMTDQIDEAIQRGRDAIWKHGLLRKEPCLCHGILGNALALPHGAQRHHFVAWSSPEKIAEERAKDRNVFPPRDSDQTCLWMDYWPSAAWSWLSYGLEEPGVILFSDV